MTHLSNNSVEKQEPSQFKSSMRKYMRR